MKFNFPDVDTATWVRAFMVVLVAVNIILGYFGMSPLKTTESDVSAIIDAAVVIVTGVVILWGWWKNNSFTEEAQTADAYLAVLKEGGDL